MLKCGASRHVGRLLHSRLGSIPFELVNDGGLLLLIDRMLHLRGGETVRISKVKEHADEGIVLDGWCREIDRLGNVFPALLVLIIVGSVILVGRSVAMVLLLDLVRVPLSLSCMIFWDSFVIL